MAQADMWSAVRDASPARTAPGRTGVLRALFVSVSNGGDFGAPRPMKMGTIVSPWRYDFALRSTRRPPRLRRPVRKQTAHRVGIALDREHQGARWRVQGTTGTPSDIAPSAIAQ